jgi:microcystin-dependent protein
MTRSTSPRYQISYVSPTLRDEPADVPGDIKRLVDAIEVSAMYLQGTIAARPAAAIAGRLYFATNELILYYDSGTAWTAIGPPVPAQQVPAGTVMQYAGGTAPTGYLLCDGASYLVATYTALHAAIGYAYGGSGANFNVPSLKGRVPVGRDAAQGQFDTLGEAGGENTHALTTAELASHNHTGGTGATSHYHGLGAPGTSRSQIGGWTDPTYRGSLAVGGPYGDGTDIYDLLRVSDENAHTHGFTTNASGSGAGHNNVQPYVVMNYIIRTGLLA